MRSLRSDGRADSHERDNTASIELRQLLLDKSSDLKLEPPCDPELDLRELAELRSGQRQRDLLDAGQIAEFIVALEVYREGDSSNAVGSDPR